MNIIEMIALIKALPETAANQAMSAATRAEAAADIAQNYGWTMTCTDSNSDGNVVITKSS